LIDHLTHKLLLLIFILNSLNQAHASAWNIPKNKALVINEYTHKFYSLKTKDMTNKYKLREDLVIHNEEYGASDNLTIGFKLLYLKHSFKETANIFNNQPITDKYTNKIADFYFRYRLWQTQKFVLSLQPLMNHKSFELRALFGYSYKNKKNQQEFYNVELAHSSNKAFGDELIFDLTYGIYIKEDWLLMNQFFCRQKIKKQQKSYFQYTYQTQEQNTAQTMSSNTKSVMIPNILHTHVSLEQKISVVKKINEKYDIAVGFSNFMNNSNFMGNGISLALWVNL
jgi:hypothetical protein